MKEYKIYEDSDLDDEILPKSQLSLIVGVILSVIGLMVISGVIAGILYVLG